MRAWLGRLNREALSRQAMLALRDLRMGCYFVAMISWSEKWRKWRNTFTHTPQALELVWRTNRWATVGLALLTFGGALLPATQAWVGKLIVDGVVASIQNGADPVR